MFEIIKKGVNYSEIMPKQKKLYSFFPDVKWVFYVQILQKIIPPFSVVLFLWFYILKINEHYIIHSLLSSLVVFSTIFQAYFLLGIRAKSTIPESFLPWYQELEQKLKRRTLQPQPFAVLPTFEDFVILLKEAEEQFGQEYFDDL